MGEGEKGGNVGGEWWGPGPTGSERKTSSSEPRSDAVEDCLGAGPEGREKPSRLAPIKKKVGTRARAAIVKTSSKKKIQKEKRIASILKKKKRPGGEGRGDLPAEERGWE